VFDHFDDQGAIRCAVADILIIVSKKNCPDEIKKEIRALLEKAVDVAHKNSIEEMKA
jgi:hypothetical protein